MGWSGELGRAPGANEQPRLEASPEQGWGERQSVLGNNRKQKEKQEKGGSSQIPRGPSKPASLRVLDFIPSVAAAGLRAATADSRDLPCMFFPKDHPTA